MNMIRKLTSAAVLAGVALTASGVASAFPDFTVDPDTIDTIDNLGAIDWGTFVADKMTGNYSEVVTFGAGTFNVAIKWEAGQFVANDGNDALAAGDTGLGNDYDLYALFAASGTFAISGADVLFSFTPGGSLGLWFDAARDTTFNQPLVGSDPFTTNNDIDDILLGTGAVVFGSGDLDTSCGPLGTINCGSFGTNTSFALTAAGSNFFIDPVPFYNLAFESGQFNNFQVAGTQVINGSLDVVFGQVPEPATIALMGAALLGIGSLRRRKLV